MTDIGGVKLKNRFLSAPLAGVTDCAMRRINMEFGAGLVYSEMISGKGFIYNNKGTEELLEFSHEEEPMAYQIFGCEPEIMFETARGLADRKNKILDINMGCPVPKIVKNGEGSALLKEPRKIYDIVKSVVEGANKPVTVKIRIGWDERSINCVEIAKIVESAGAAAVAVHGRTRMQYYAGKADWSKIKAVKEAVKIPVIGNGDIFTGMDAVNMLKETNCDFVMIGRGMLGNPWIFQNCKNAEKGMDEKEPSLTDRIETVKRHLKYLVASKGEARGVKEMRKHMAWYTKGLAGSSIFRNQLNSMISIDEVQRKIEEFHIFLRERK